MEGEVAHKAPTGIEIRHVTSADAQAMAAVFFASFTPSHRFWQYLMADDAAGRQWWDEAWRLGIEEDPTAATFVAVDSSSQSGKIVGFSRWIYPQADGNLQRLWPSQPLAGDAEVSSAFFGGMERNRLEIMGARPHWFLEMLGVDEAYQGRGIAWALVDWGCRQADEQRLETYLDASKKGLPFYKKNFGFVARKPIPIPDRPEFGSYVYTSIVRPVGASPA